MRSHPLENEAQREELKQEDGRRKTIRRLNTC
jgi:uncharacterized protein Veg